MRIFNIFHIVVFTAVLNLGYPCEIAMKPKQNTFVENNSGTFQCSTSNCIDGPETISWTIGGAGLSGSNTGPDRNNITRSTVTYTFRRADNGKTLICKTNSDEDQVTLNVRYKPTTVNLSPSTVSYTKRKGNNLGSITCSADCNPTCTYKWNKKSSSNVLSINNVQKGDAGSYRCTATNTIGSASSPTITVDVQYKPTTVILSPSRLSYQIGKGDNLGPINCSADCNPTCTYKWNKGSNNDVLSINNIQKSDAGSYRCTATNTIGSASSSTITVDVHYIGDTVSLSPSSLTHTVRLGNNVPTVSCSADCKPPCSYQWSRTGSSQLILNNVQKSDSGSYVCTASNSEGKRNSSTVSVIVQYSPSTVNLSPSTTSYEIKLGNNLGSITCSADCNPACTYTWNRGSSNDVLNINNIQKSNAGSYRCTANNFIGSASSPYINVNVIYGPSSVTLNPPTTQYTVIEDIDSIGEITCQSACNPICSYSWSRTGKSALQFSPVKRSNSGKYTCTAKNKVSSKNSTAVDITVHYPPSVSTSTITDYEGRTLTLYCNASGNPAKYTYTSWTHKIGDQTIRVLANQGSNSVSLTNVTYMDQGNYYCTASNNIPDVNRSEVQSGLAAALYIRAAPFGFRISNKVIAQVGQNFSFSIPIFNFATGALSVEWFRKSSGKSLKNSAKYSFKIQSNLQTLKIYTVPVELYGYQAYINISSFTEEDFGEYVAIIKNTIGKHSCHLLITRGLEEESSNSYNGVLVGGIVMIVLSIAIVAAFVLVYLILYKKGKLPIPCKIRTRSENYQQEEESAYTGLKLEEVGKSNAEGDFTNLNRESPYINVNTAPSTDEKLYENQPSRNKSHHYENHYIGNNKNGLKKINKKKKKVAPPRKDTTNTDNQNSAMYATPNKPKIPNLAKQVNQKVSDS